MTLTLSDVTSFFQKMESKTINKDGILNQTEAEQAYKQMSSSDIPQEIKDKFGSGGLNADFFNQIDPLGVKDGFINDHELYKFVSGDSSFKPYTPPAGSGTIPSFADAGYLVKCHCNKPNAEASSAKLIQDTGGILGAANDGGVADDKLSKLEVEHAITLIRANEGTVDNAEGKAKLLESIDQHFDSEKDASGFITKSSLANALKSDSSISSEKWS